MKILPHFTLLALLLTTLFFAPSLHSNSDRQIAAVKNNYLQKQFQTGMDQIFQLMLERLGDREFSLESGGKIKLSEIALKTKTIQFISYQSIFAQDIASDTSCFDSLSFQWLTASDNPFSKRPLIAYPRGNTLSDLEGDTWRLLVHESLSAIGIVDDEYQISAPLFSAFYAKTKEAREESLALIAQIKTRKHAPKYKFDSDVLCYKWKSNSMAELMLDSDSGNSTGIGGGGNEDSLAFKTELLPLAKPWWKIHNDKNYSEVEYKRFLGFVNSIGIEPLRREENNLVTLYPIQMEFRQSKRTGKLSAYFFLRVIMNEQLKSDGYAKTAAIETIFRHVYEQILPAKSEKARNRNTIYGSDLAQRRGLIKTSSLKGAQGPFFVKEAK